MNVRDSKDCGQSAPDREKLSQLVREMVAEKHDVEVEYALRTKANPIGVAVYQLQSKLPGEFKGKLPTAKQLAGIVRAEMEGGK